MTHYKALVLIGSESDRPIMNAAEPYYAYFGVEVDLVVSSAHRSPKKTAEIAASARKNGYSAIVCGAGMAAHLAGVCAAYSDLPVLGVPLPGGVQNGLDALLSTVQMPSGAPVATFAVGKAGAINAAVFVASIIALHDDDVRLRLEKFIEAGRRLPEKT